VEEPASPPGRFSPRGGGSNPRPGPSFPSPLLGEGGEIRFELGPEARCWFQSVVDFHAIAQVSQDGLQMIQAEALDEELDDQGRFVIGKLQVEIGRRREEGPLSLPTGVSSPSRIRVAVAGSHPLTPAGLAWASQRRKSLAEPAGHFVPR